MFRIIKYLISFLVLIIIFVILIKGLQNNNKQTINDKLIKINKNIIFETLYNDETFTLKNLSNKNKYLIINIWASWCSPCREEHHYLMTLKDNGITILGLNYKDNSTNAKFFINEMGNPYSKILLDKDGTKSIELGAIGVPETYLYDTDSYNIIKKYIGPLDDQKTKDILELIKK